MRIRIYGAGVLGSLYTARRFAHGHDVSFLTREQRLADIRMHGVMLDDVNTGRSTTTLVPVVARLTSDDTYDLAIVPMRRDWQPLCRRLTPPAWSVSRVWREERTHDAPNP